MAINFNNIYVRYMGRDISIAQHDLKGETVLQEVFVDDEIIRYDATLPSLITVLERIRDEIDTEGGYREPSGESTATATQSPASSTAQEGQQTQT